MKLIRTDHHADSKGKEIVRNYFVLTDPVVSRSKIERFAEEHTSKDPNVPTNVFAFTTLWAAEVKDYHDLLADDYLRYADQHPVCYLNGYLLENPMIDDIYKFIVDNIGTLRDKKFKEIYYIFTEEKYREEGKQDQLELLMRFLDDKEETR